MRIVFSRDRAAQLDLLLRSIDRNMPPEETHVIWLATSPAFEEAYLQVLDTPMQEPGEFNVALRQVLDGAGETVTFFCDDDIVFRPLPDDPVARLLSDDRVLSFCLYLGAGNVKQAIPAGFPVWNWVGLDRHDFGFPCAVDGNTYRTVDVLRMIGNDSIHNPTFVEVVMGMRLRAFTEKRPMMASFDEQCLVGVPVNRVSESPYVPHGGMFPQSTEELNRLFLAGHRIDLDRLNFSGIDSCHHEVRFQWT